MTNKSEVFEAFVKIAEEKGMIPLDAPDKAKEKLEKSPRWDSYDVSAIEALYGVKPDLPKENQYSRNIIEDAHPRSVILAPAHDKLNGLVENENERQDILLHIIQKTPNGLSTHHKYANQDLVLTLVRIANDLDNRNQDELRKLADVCLEQATGTFKKEAVAWLPVIGVAVGLLAALYTQQHLSFVNEGFERNHQKLVAEIDDLLTATANWGVGHQYKQTFLNTMHDFRNRLTSFYDLYRQKAEPLMKELERPKDGAELLEKAQQPQSKTIVEAHDDLTNAAQNMRAFIEKIAENFKSESYKVRQIEETGFLTGLLEKTHALVGGKGLIADDFDDVVRAISPYLGSIDEIVNVLERSKSLEYAAKEDMQKWMVAKEEVKPKKEVALEEPDLEGLEAEFEGLPELS
jgi:hypothetical protein